MKTDKLDQNELEYLRVKEERKQEEITLLQDMWEIMTAENQVTDKQRKTYARMHDTLTLNF